MSHSIYQLIRESITDDGILSEDFVLPEENSEQIKRFLAAHPEFALAPLPDSVDERFRAQYGDAGLQLLPHRDRVEGFFIAKMRRIK